MQKHDLAKKLKQVGEEGRVNLLNSKVEREKRGFRFQVKSSLVVLARRLWIKFLCQLEDLFGSSSVSVILFLQQDGTQCRPLDSEQ